MKQICIFERHSDYIRDLEDDVNGYIEQLDILGVTDFDIKMAAVPAGDCDLRWFSIMLVYDDAPIRDSEED
jgi:hypothetical protein